MDGGGERGGIFGVSRGDTAPAFEVQEGVFNQMPCLVKIDVVGELFLVVFPRRNNDFFFCCAQRFENTIFSIVAPVCQDRFGFKRWQKHVRSIQSARLSEHQAEACRITQRVDSRVDFRA